MWNIPIVFDNNNWKNQNADGSMYFNSYVYDANGNILSLQRKNKDGIMFDNFTYNYQKKDNHMVSNRLYHVNDAVDAGFMPNDIDDQDNIDLLDNYSYDELGNLTSDKTEGIDDIEWTAYGKIKSITRINGYSKTVNGQTVYPSNLEFRYDATGNRIAKIEKPRDASGQKSWEYWLTTYYVRDATGNPMGTYIQSAPNSATSYKLIERPIYGSSRVGIDNTPLELIGYTAPTSGILTHELGLKQYEFSNHLGNVLTTVSDKKIPVDDGNNGTIDYYVADITSATDYYPFGSPMNGRTFSSDEYRFGFNGQEKDDEVAGAGNINTAMFWEYDTRTGRRWNLDPVKKANKSHYLTFHDNPIKYSDPNGDWPPEGEGGFRFNYSLGGGGFSASLYAGVSAKNNFLMAGLNVSATFIRGGAGTSKTSPNLFTLTLSPSFTFGNKTASPMNLNTFNSMSGSGVNNAFDKSFTVGGNLILSSGEGRSQWIGYHGFRFGNFSIGHYNDIWSPKKGLFGMGSDQYCSAGLNAQFKNGDYTLSWSNFMYYGKSNNKASWSSDRHIGKQNYDNQSIFDMLLNNGNENITLSSGRYGILQSGTRSGYQTFWPSNKMHDNIPWPDEPTGNIYSFHHLFVAYPNTQQRTIQYLNGN